MSPPQRISIVGPCGSGKTTLARQVAAALNVERLELDSLQHQPNWNELAPKIFLSRVDEFLKKSKWVIDGNYSRIGALDLIWAQADLVVWLDLPRRITQPRLIGRSLKRSLTQEELWNGNREKFWSLLSLDSDKNFALWAWHHHPKVQAKYRERTSDSKWSHLKVLRLRSPQAVRRWKDQLLGG